MAEFPVVTPALAIVFRALGWIVNLTGKKEKTNHYAMAQWFDPPPRCEVCDKPAGKLMDYSGNSPLAYMCSKHALTAIKAASNDTRRPNRAMLSLKED